MIIELLVSLVSVSIFAFGFYLSGIGSAAKNVIQQTYQGIKTMTDRQMTDEEKEIAVRRAGFAVFLGAWAIFWRFSVSLAATYVPIYLADTFGIADQNDIISLMFRLDYIVIVSLVLITFTWLLGRQNSDKKIDSEASYGLGERMIHMIAFASPILQKIAAHIDDSVFFMFHRKVEHCSPIFITSLARGGTTALLNALGDLSSIATHTYRDMPFITAPYIWNKISTPFRKKVKKKERAHGDGLEIDLDSSEAFDEVYWRLYWPEKYNKQKIDTWKVNDFKDGAAVRLYNCFQKIVYVRKRSAAYYLSKNNANIARLQLIGQLFPGAQVVVPVRRPAPHAASLFRQHLNFLEQHSKDDFIRRYMYDIGHLEFGQLHTPIAFDNFDNTAYSPDSPDYWMAYWIAAFQEVLANLDTCHIVLQDDLRSNPNSCMRSLLVKLNLEDSNRDFSTYFRKTKDETDNSVFAPHLLEIADELYEKIAKSAVR